MKLIRASIENFGKLQNLTIDFQEGSNEFHYENGWGKSTFAAFIKVMFYGFGNERSRDDYMNERKRYRPWQGGVYGGSLTFSVKGRLYTVTRTFGQKERDDQFTLREEATNLESSDYSSRLGEELFHIDRNSFQRTVFLSQNDCETWTTDQIHAKLGNLTEATDDVKQYDKADSRLNDLLNKMSPDRKTGSLYRMKEEIAALELEVKKGEYLESEIETLLLEKKTLQKEYLTLKLKQEELSEELRRVSIDKDTQTIKEQYRMLTRQYAERQEKLNRIRRFFPMELPVSEELNAMIQQCIFLAAEENQKEIYHLSRQELQQLEEMESFYGEVYDSKHTEAVLIQKEESRSTWINRMIVGLGILLALGGGIFLYMEHKAGTILFMTGCVILAIGIVILCNGNKQKNPKSKVLMDENTDDRKKLEEYERLKRKKEYYDEAVRLYRTRKDHLCQYILDLGFFPEENLQSQLLDIQSKLKEYEFASIELEKVCREKNWFEEQQDMEGILKQEMETKGCSMEKNQNNLRFIQEKLELNHKRMADLERKIQTKMEQRERLDEKEEKFAALKEEYNRDILKYERIKLTRQYLSQAKASFTARYRSPLMQSFSRYYEMISGGSSETCHLDANMELTIEEQGMQREARYFSVGWKDLMGICFRLALIDSMYKNEKPVLIFDDPFVNLDQDKTKDALHFLKEVSKEYQVLYFTCHESRSLLQKKEDRGSM